MDRAPKQKGAQYQRRFEAVPKTSTQVARFYFDPTREIEVRGMGASAAPRPQNGISSSMSLLRAPAAAATRRGAALEGPLEPKSPPADSSGPKRPPPPPLRPSSMVSVELKPCSTTSVEYFSTPLWSVHLRVCSPPSMSTSAPLFR